MTAPVDAIVITGPTGAGKTALSLEIGARLPVEIVSVDSTMVYRGLDIGSGKPTRTELASVPHHLIDILDPSESYSAGQFVADARQLVHDIRARGRFPLLVGGTMLYLRALSRGIAPLPRANPQVRAAIDDRARERGWPALHAELAAVDPVAAARIQPRDAQRIQRALEVYTLTGEALSGLQTRAARDAQTLRLRQFAWSPSDRTELHRRIEVRFAAMLDAGLLEEVGRLHARGDLAVQLPALRSVGYRQLWHHLDGALSFDAAVAAAVQATRQLAKRQLTWMRAEPALEWRDSLESDASAQIIREITQTVLACVSA